MALIYWIGILIWGPGYFQKTLNYIFEGREPTAFEGSSRVPKRRFLIFSIVAVVYLATMCAFLFLDMYMELLGIHIPFALFFALSMIVFMLAAKRKLKGHNQEDQKGK